MNNYPKGTQLRALTDYFTPVGEAEVEQAREWIRQNGFTFETVKLLKNQHQIIVEIK